MDIAKIRKKLKKSEEDREKNGAAAHTPHADDESGSSPADTGTEITGKETPLSESKPESSSEDREKADPGTSDSAPSPPPGKEPKAEHIKEQSSSRESAVKERVSAGQEEESVEILTFSLLKEEFAFRISQLEEIIRHQRITRVPKTPAYVLGITSLRGKIIPVIDLKLKLSLSDNISPDTNVGKILIIKSSRGPMGVAVDKVTGVIPVAKSQILPPPSHLSDIELKFIDGIAVINKRFVSIINMGEATALNLK